MKTPSNYKPYDPIEQINKPKKKYKIIYWITILNYIIGALNLFMGEVVVGVIIIAVTFAAVQIDKKSK